MWTKGRPADDQSTDPVRRCDSDDGLDGLAVEKTPIATDHQNGPRRKFQNIKNRLHETFKIVFLPEYGNLFAQACGAWFLIAKRRAFHVSGYSISHLLNL